MKNLKKNNLNITEIFIPTYRIQPLQKQHINMKIFLKNRKKGKIYKTY